MKAYCVWSHKWGAYGEPAMVKPAESGEIVGQTRRCLRCNAVDVRAVIVRGERQGFRE